MDHCEFVYPEGLRQVGGEEILVLHREDTALSMLLPPFLPSLGGQYRRPSLVLASAGFRGDEEVTLGALVMESGAMRWAVYLY